jgi:Terminase large subunit, T4likevirus-type, N-terminal
VINPREQEILPPLPEPQRLIGHDVQVLPDPARRWLTRPENAEVWPASEAQARALDCPADILLLGGAAGSLKTSTMLIDAIQERDYPTMRSYFFRRTYAELEGGDGAIDQSLRLFPQTGATYNASTHTWKWPSGAEFYFRHAQHEKNVYPYQGHAMSFLGIDESTHWPEKMVRYLITRNRSTDPDVKVRVRLGTNPGNVGHKWHQKLFLGGVCPHCEGDRAPAQWTWNSTAGLHWDSRWPSDGQPLSIEIAGHLVALSTAYILSSVRDHQMYKPEYQARLKMQSPTTAKALLEGCWKIFEGQYFDVWEPNRIGRPMVIPRRELGEEWWWPRWVGSDYGFTISIGAAHLAVHVPQSTEWPRGRIAIVDEFGAQETAANFAKELIKRWVLGSDGRPIEQRWMPWYLSPDSFREIGIGFTLAAQMNAELQKHGLQFGRADNDRIGGAMKMYSGFETGELVICQECTKTIEAIESRIHDPDKENDVKKITGEDLDDYYDSARYTYKSWETARAVAIPRDVQIAEMLGDLPKTDPTAAMHKYSQFVERERQQGTAVYGGSARQRIIDAAKRGNRR